MSKDTLAVMKFAIAVAIIVILLVVWFMTIGAPAGDEEEEEIAEIVIGCIKEAAFSTQPL